MAVSLYYNGKERADIREKCVTNRQYDNSFDYTSISVLLKPLCYIDSLLFRDFVTIPWTFLPGRPPSDLAFANMTGPVCHENFLYRDMIVCQRKAPELANIRGYSGHKPQYEMRHDGSGEPYSSILELRKAKIHNFLGVKSWPWVSDVLVIRYEDLITEGTAFLLEELERATGIEAACEPQPPQPERVKREMNQDFVRYLRDHIDWKAESLIGYKKDYV